MFKDPIASLLGSWSSDMTIYSICLRLALAIIISSIIGCERSSKRHSAGLRTFILIAFTSCISMILDMLFKLPIISAATVISIAMLSGNSVLFSSKNQIKGLTTSVGLWTCGIIGLTVGAGLYTISLITFILLLFILRYLPALEVYLRNRSNHFEIHLELKNKTSLQDFVAVIRELGMTIIDIEANNAYLGSGLSVYSIMFTVKSKELKKYKTHNEIISALATLEFVNHIEEIM